MRLAALLLLATAAFPQRHITQGRAQTITENLYKCPQTVNNHRISAVGRITATDGTVLTVPAQTAYPTRPTADLYNECAPRNLAPLKPVIIDPDGELITAHIVADNYFELYVNGTLVATDNTPYTPFNSAIVQFRAKRPLTYAFKLVDWEENLGLGTELMRGDPWYPGDGGLIARFSDGTVTDHTWRAQSFYIAPLNTPSDVTEKPGNIHDTSALGRVHPHAKKPPCQDKCFAVHYPIPANWASPNFNPQWPAAVEYTDEEVGVTNLPAYTKFPNHFQGARWIWSSNLVFDNLVFIRKTVP
jgi:hypothetical protein